MRYVLLFIVALQSHAQVSDFDYINFKKADSLALACNNEGLDNLPQLTHRLTSSLNTDVERFRAIYKWVCSNIANDYNLYSRNKSKRTKFKNDSLKLTLWNNRFKKIIFKKLLKRTTYDLYGLCLLGERAFRLGESRLQNRSWLW